MKRRDSEGSGSVQAKMRGSAEESWNEGETSRKICRTIKRQISGEIRQRNETESEMSKMPRKNMSEGSRRMGVGEEERRK